MTAIKSTTYSERRSTVIPDKMKNTGKAYVVEVQYVRDILHPTMAFFEDRKDALVFAERYRHKDVAWIGVHTLTVAQSDTYHDSQM